MGHVRDCVQLLVRTNVKVIATIVVLAVVAMAVVEIVKTAVKEIVKMVAADSALVDVEEIVVAVVGLHVIQNV